MAVLGAISYEVITVTINALTARLAVLINMALKCGDTPKSGCMGTMIRTNIKKS